MVVQSQSTSWLVQIYSKVSDMARPQGLMRLARVMVMKARYAHVVRMVWCVMMMFEEGIQTGVGCTRVVRMGKALEGCPCIVLGVR